MKERKTIFNELLWDCFANHHWPRGNHDLSQPKLVVDVWLQLLTRKMEGVLIRRIARKLKPANCYNSPRETF